MATDPPRRRLRAVVLHLLPLFLLFLLLPLWLGAETISGHPRDGASICGAYNKLIRKHIFAIPRFKCACGKEYLEDNDLDFSLADVKVNGQPLVPKIFHQDGPECVANAYCQTVQMNHVIDSVFKNQTLDPRMLKQEPKNIVKEYEDQHPLYKIPPTKGGLEPGGIHKDGSYYRIGDATAIPVNEYTTLCEEFADGVPLPATFQPGHSILDLQYGQIYNLPLVRSAFDCGTMHPWARHTSHMAVLVGAKSDYETGERAFHFVNSWENWCDRTSINHHPDMVDRGVGRLHQHGVLTNTLKLWLPGESAVKDPRRFVDEPSGRYYNTSMNLLRYLGSYYKE